MSTVTVTKTGKRYKISFSSLPNRSFGPWGFSETVLDLTVSALLSPVNARNLVMDASVKGTATTQVNY